MRARSLIFQQLAVVAESGYGSCIRGAEKFLLNSSFIAKGVLKSTSFKKSLRLIFYK